MIQLMHHQAEGAERMRSQPRFFPIYDPGTGKTAMTLAVIAEDRMKTLVVAPLSILHTAWADDAAKFFPSLKTSVCWASSPAKRRQLINAPADVLITNYDTFRRHADDFLAAGVRRLVVDESSKLRNWKSQISLAAYEFSTNPQIESVYLLSGTPAPNSDVEYYGQVRCVAPKLFGPSFWRFAYNYFSPTKRMIQGKERIIGWKPLAEKRDEFIEKLASISLVKRATDCLDLPGETDEIRQVDLSPDELSCYVDLLVEMQHEWNDGEVTQVSAIARTMKLRQVTGGAMYAEDAVREIGNSKIEALQEILEELGDRQTVIWCAFTHEIDRLMEQLDDCRRLDGRVGAADRTSTIRDFQAGKLHYVVAHPAAAGHGITLHAARYDIFFSLDFKPEDHQQARARIYRNGQHWPVTHYYLIARGTVDEKVYRVLKDKAVASDAMKELLSGESEAAQLAPAG